jgi:hypothetical protein
MQVRCTFYGLINASSGVECAIEHDLLEVGEHVQCNDQDYIIVSVVESQGRWFANVVPESQRPFACQPPTAQRLRDSLQQRAFLRAWRERVDQAEHELQILHEACGHVGERLDHLMHMLELITKEPEKLAQQPLAPRRERRGGRHVRREV